MDQCTLFLCPHLSSPPPIVSVMGSWEVQEHGPHGRVSRCTHMSAFTCFINNNRDTEQVFSAQPDIFGLLQQIQQHFVKIPKLHQQQITNGDQKQEIKIERKSEATRNVSYSSKTPENKPVKNTAEDQFGRTGV